MHNSEAATQRPDTDLPGGDVPAWHSLAVDRALDSVRASAGGLDTAEAERRLETFGANRLPEPERRPAWRRLLVQFHNVLIYALIAAAGAAPARRPKSGASAKCSARSKS